MKQKAKHLQSLLLLLILSVVGVANAWGDDIVTTPFNLSTGAAVIDFSADQWRTDGATALFGTANTGGTGIATAINNVVFRGQTSDANKAFSINEGELVMAVGNGQTTNRWFAIPLTGINGRIDVYIQAPYAKGTSFSIKAVLDKGTTVVTTTSSASGIAGMKIDYVDNYFDTGVGAFHFRIKDFTETTGVLYLGRNGGNWTNINKVKIVSEAAHFTVSPESVTVSDAGTANVTISNNTPYTALIASELNANATYSYDGSSTITVTGVNAGDAGNIKVYLDINGNGEYDAETESETLKTIPVTVNGLSWSTNLNTDLVRYTTRGASATKLTVEATNSPNYQWYKNSKMSTAGATAISGATSKDYKPSTDFDEDLSYYYCVASKTGYKDVVSNIKPVMTTVSKRKFWMNTITRRSTTTTSGELALTNGEDVNIAGGSATFKSGGSNFNYVYVYDDAFFHVNSGSYYYMINLNNALTAGMTITLTTNGLTDGRGVWLSKSSSRPADDDASRVAFTGTNGVNTQSYTVRTGDAIIGADVLYVYSSNGSSSGYFGPLYITEALPLTVSAATPATQTVQKDETAATISVNVSGGVPDYHYQWYQDTSATGSFTTIAEGTGDNTASFTPSTASTGTMYYRCTVTDSKSPTPATVNSSVVSVEVKTNVDYYEIGTSANPFTEGKYTFETTKPKYDAQTAASRNYWTIVSYSGSVDSYCWNSKSPYEILTKNNGSSNGVKSTTIYVKGATAFRVITNGSDSRTYSVTIDGTNIGNEERRNAEATATMHTINSNGSIITLTNTASDAIRILSIIFYEKIPTTLNIQKNGAEITEDVVYVDNASTTFNYDVYTDGNGTIGATPTIENPDGKTVVSNASYADGVLTITKGTDNGTATITLNQDETTTHKGATATLRFTLKKHQIAISVSASEVTLEAKDCGNAGDVIAASKLPVFTVTKDGEPYTPAAGEIKYVSDDNSVAYLSTSGDFSSDSYAVHYGGGQGGPKIIAYINDTEVLKGANKSYYLHIDRGTINIVPDENISVQQSYEMDDANGQTVVKLVYGGYRYNSHKLDPSDDGKTDSWSSYGALNAQLDGYTRNRRNGQNDAMSETISFMSSDPKNANVWYQTTDKKDGSEDFYADNERIKPFAMPCAGSYLMFEVKKTGILTAYVVQNGIIGKSSTHGDDIASNPRIGYWVDQDGWVQHPTAVVSKAVIADGFGRNTHDYSGKAYGTPNSLESTTFYGPENGNPSLLYRQLTYPYCSVEDPDKNTPATAYSTTQDATYKYHNPYCWLTEAEVDVERAKQVPRKIRPIPYRNGYLMIDEGYLKYTLPVKAGQKYYFFGSGTKIGYVAMNFVEDPNAFGTGTIDFVDDNVDLKGSDDWTVSTGSPVREEGFTKPTKPTVYTQMTLKRNFTPNQWNTICLPFAVSEKDVEEIFGKDTKLCLYNGLTKMGNNTYVINFIRHVNQDILPGQPYFIYPTGTGVELGENGKIGGTTGVEFYNVLVDPAKLVAGINYGSDKDREEGSSTKINEIRYKAVATIKPTGMKQYGFYMDATNGSLLKYTSSSDLTVNTYRAFLQPNEFGGTNYSALSLDGDFGVDDMSDEGDTPTMIIVVGEDKAEIVNGKLFDGKAYNIMGQEVDATTTKGLVIVNGKKYYR